MRQNGKLLRNGGILGNDVIVLAFALKESSYFPPPALLPPASPFSSLLLFLSTSPLLLVLDALAILLPLLYAFMHLSTCMFWLQKFGQVLPVLCGQSPFAILADFVHANASQPTWLDPYNGMRRAEP